MHEHGERHFDIPPDQTFAGKSLLKHIVRIKQIIEVLGSQTILDYGSGKGTLYQRADIKFPGSVSFSNVTEFWNLDSITCYDPAYQLFAAVPSGTFGGVVCTDVLEHCPEDDIPWILAEIFSYAREFVYLNVACYPAKKSLPNGENAHCTIRAPEWWKALFEAQVGQCPGLRYYAAVDIIQNGSLKELLFRGKCSLTVAARDQRDVE